MKRRNFIKAFAAACCVPVVAAKAIASHRKRPRLFIDNTLQNTINAWKDYEDVQIVYDDDVNAWHIKPEDAPISKLIKYREVWFDSDWGQVKVRPSPTSAPSTIN